MRKSPLVNVFVALTLVHNLHRTIALIVPTTITSSFATIPSQHFHKPCSYTSTCTSLSASQGSDQQSGISNSNSNNNPLSSSSSKKPNLIRGERYNDVNSTIPPPEQIASQLNVLPTKEASAKTWKRAWMMHKRALPLLHSLDSCKPTDSSLNLACMWWKALAGNDKSSPVYDDGLSYDLLPSGFRRIVKWPLRRLYPRLHHANVELRTAFLDNAIHEIITDVKNIHTEDKKQIQLICMGAGYDLRGVKMLERGWVDRVIEMDLPDVVKAKERLFQRLIKRRPKLSHGDDGMNNLPSLIPANFNNVDDVREKLNTVIRGEYKLNPNSDSKSSTSFDTEWYTIFVFEGVMIYLNEGVPSLLLGVTSEVLKDCGFGSSSGSLALADRLENVPGGDYELGTVELERNGWKIQDWKPKPGLARHMLKADLLP